MLFLKLTIAVILHILVANSLVAQTLQINQKSISGSTPITSQVSASVFADRALEDALRNLLAEVGGTLRGISLVENGRLLFDQIQKTSDLKILEYQILSSNRNQKYHEVEVLFTYINNVPELVKKSCNELKLDNVETLLKVNSSARGKIPWAQLNKDMISEQLSKLEFSPDIKHSTLDQIERSDSSYYTLNKQTKKDKVYQLVVEITYELQIQSNLLGRGAYLNILINMHTLRNGSVLKSESFRERFLTDFRAINDMPIARSRRDWSQTENKIIDYISESFADYVTGHKCVSITPTLSISNSLAVLDIGQIEGLNSSDLAVYKTKNGRELFFKVDKLFENTAELSPISSDFNLNSLSKSKVEIIAGG